jgi:hypothetical protein
MLLNTFRRTFSPRREFNPARNEDLIELKYFKDKGKWKSGCPFYLEDPFIDVPAMCASKFTDFMLERTIKTRKS